LNTVLKYGLLFTFLIATLFYNLRFTYLVSFYTFNNQSFTELYCENQDKPEMECNGKCAITKASKDINQEKNDLTLNSFQKEITFYVDFSMPVENFSVKTTHFPNYRYLNDYSFLFTSQIAHPPMGTS
jgi:hypothetical protein